jgi:hypothetical protein
LIATIAPKFAKLPPAQRRLWPELRPGIALGLVLYGGTAISLHLGHRRSVDFDFFTDRPLDKSAVRKAFGFLRDANTHQDARDTLVVLVPGARLRSRDAVKVSFFGGMKFGRVGDPLLSADGVLEVASLDDLMAHKLKVILQRGERKDYEDIAAMIRAGVDVARGLAAARLFFGRTFQPAESLKALVYFRDGDLPHLSSADRTTLIDAASAVGALPRIETRARRLAIPL